MRKRNQIADNRSNVAAHVPMGAAWAQSATTPGTDGDIRGYMHLNSTFLCTNAHSPPCCFLQRFP